MNVYLSVILYETILENNVKIKCMEKMSIYNVLNYFLCAKTLKNLIKYLLISF